MRKLLLIIFAVAVATNADAAINAQYTFEKELPSFLSVNGNGKIELSKDKFKDGATSVRFSWEGPSEIVFSNFSDIESSMKVNGAGLMLWVYNTKQMNEAQDMFAVTYLGYYEEDFTRIGIRILRCKRICTGLGPWCVWPVPGHDVYRHRLHAWQYDGRSYQMR